MCRGIGSIYRKFGKNRQKQKLAKCNLAKWKSAKPELGETETWQKLNSVNIF